MKRYSKLIILLCLFATSCEQKRSPNEQGLDGYNIKKNPGYVMLLLSTTGLFLGGCEGEAQRRASFFPEFNTAYTRDMNNSTGSGYYLLKLQNAKPIRITYESLTNGCKIFVSSYWFCNGLFSSAGNYSLERCKTSNNQETPQGEGIDNSMGKVTCNADPKGQLLTSFLGSYQKDYRTGKDLNCKLSIYFENF